MATFHHLHTPRWQIGSPRRHSQVFGPPPASFGPAAHAHVGVATALLLDTTGDGKSDASFVDTDGDGVPDKFERL